MAQTIELKQGDSRCALRPDLGGVIAGLWLGDLAVLRSTEGDLLASAREAGSFPLVPYSNRIGYRRFHWQGRSFTIASHFADEPHSIHGVGWMRAWAVEALTPAAATLSCRHAGDDDWPFAFDAVQRIELEPGRLNLRLELTNTGASSMPAGLGWHPYFPRRKRSRIRLDLSERWEMDAAKLPVRSVAQPGIDADVAVLSFDHCFGGWAGEARIRDELLSIRLGSSLSRVVVYTPQDRDYFCVEPVSHVNNAINMAEPQLHGVISLAPGESTVAGMHIAFSKA